MQLASRAYFAGVKRQHPSHRRLCEGKLPTEPVGQPQSILPLCNFWRVQRTKSKPSISFLDGGWRYLVAYADQCF
jgi:hypothetical protein